MKAPLTTFPNRSESDATNQSFPGGKTDWARFQQLLCAALLALTALATQARELSATNTPSAIPWNEIGAKAGADYQGDGLAVTPAEFSASLHCVFQRLDGEATSEGLWLTSTVTNMAGDRFRVTAAALARTVANATLNSPGSESVSSLPTAGQVSVRSQTVCWNRPGLTEEYSVSLDGVRQDFIVEEAPLRPLAGELMVQLTVTGAQVEPAADGARLVLANSGRKIAYSRLRVTDATGKELPARIEVSSVESEATGLDAWGAADKDIEAESVLTLVPAKEELAVVVNDAEAVYPVRIDPTFSDANWVSMGGFPGANGTVDAAVLDGSGNLYIGGQFTIVDNVVANGIAKWNGQHWSALGSGISGVGDEFGPYVEALAVSGSTLYAGGDFTAAGGVAATNIAQWNGTNWSALGSGMSSHTWNGYPASVFALAVSGSTLYVGGSFIITGGSREQGGFSANNIAEWNGSNWSPLGSGISGVGDDWGAEVNGPSVFALAVSGSTLYAGGAFTEAGGVAATNIAQWNGTNWSTLGSALSGNHYAFVDVLAVLGGTLYAGGDFTDAGGDTNGNFIAQWNGTSWSGLGSGVDYEVFALAVSGNMLYAGGVFTGAGGDTNANFIAQWNGTGWSNLGSGFATQDQGREVAVLAASGGTLYAGGIFTAAGGTVANNLAQWDGNRWSGFGSGMNVAVNALAVSGGTVYAGGSFTTAGGVAANAIAEWNGSNWSALDSGITGQSGAAVNALAVSAGTLYAGGSFTQAGGSAANNIAQWNGSSWSALGSGMNNAVIALAVTDGNLYAGGWFTTAGGNSAMSIAQWSGSNWSALNSGILGVGADGGGPYVSALAVSGGTLYAGGDFTTAGGNAASYIAQWNGSNWSALGSGVNGEVNALAVTGSTLYAGGGFTAAGGIGTRYIAEWNGSNWSALGSGMNNEVVALAVTDGNLYAGGWFTMAGGDAVNYIAQWNGSNWSALGSGMNGSVRTLAVSGNTLYAGGEFTTAGTNVSAYAAMAYLAGPPGSLAIITTNTSFGFTDGVFGFDVSGPSGANVVIQGSADLQAWISLQTNLLGSGMYHFSDSQSTTNVRRFYRAQLSP
ncbi:MAG: hypothetical protein ABSH48_21125 [Verrucomicrobiota bacterium]